MLTLNGSKTPMAAPSSANGNADRGALRAFVHRQCANGVECLRRVPGREVKEVQE